MDLDPRAPDPLARGTQVLLDPIRHAMGRMTAARERLTLTPHGLAPSAGRVVCQL
jgi:hypothetical protein